MNMSFGKYKGKPVAWVMFKDINYFLWMQHKKMQDKQEFGFMLKLLKEFDQMPIINAKCKGECRGQNPVVKLVLYNNTCNGPYWFCDKCDPYFLGATPGKLSEIRCSGGTFSYCKPDIFKIVANAKGFPKRKTENALKNFFGY